MEPRDDAAAVDVPVLKVRPADRPSDGLPGPEVGIDIPTSRALELLRRGALRIEGQLIHGSNHTFLVRVEDEEDDALAIYKPREGERPLWDFPTGTLCDREVAAYHVATALGWHFVPPTILREGELGPGMVQLFVPHDSQEHFLEMEGIAHRDVARLVVFDTVINNADRKSGHVLRSADGRLWAIDHGVSFHVAPKLRTVIWDLAGQPLTADARTGLRRLLAALPDATSSASDASESPGERVTDQRATDQHAASDHTPERDPYRRNESPPDAQRLPQRSDALADATRHAHAHPPASPAAVAAAAALTHLLAPAERAVIGERVEALLHADRFPTPDPGERSIPWPPV